MMKNLLTTIVLLGTMLMVRAQQPLTGRVISKDDNSPLPGAHVSVEGLFLSTVTRDDGTFNLGNIKSGKWVFRVTYVGYETLEQQVTIPTDGPITLALNAMTYVSQEVIISAIRADNNSPTTYNTIDKQEIQQQNTGRDLPYFLTSMPSTVVSSDAGAGVGYTGIRIRGTDLTGINVTLNGVPVNDGESQTVYFVDLPDLAASVSEIQVQRGVGTSTNGAASFGASINISTETYHAQPYASFSSAAGSFSTYKNSVAFGTGLLKNKWTMDGRFSDVRSDGYIDRAWSHLRSGYFSLGYNGTNNLVKAIIMLGSEETYQAWDGVPKDSLQTNRTYNPSGAIYDNNWNFLGYYDNQIDHYDQNYYQLHYGHQFNDHINLVSALFLTTGKGYYESYKNDRSFSDYGLTDTIIGSDTISTTNLIQQKWLDNKFYGANLAINMDYGNLVVNLGGGWDRYDGDHYGKVIWSQVARLGEYDRKWYDNTGTKTQFNGFLKATFAMNEKISFYGDMQYRIVSYDISGLHDDFRDLTQQHDYGFFNPKAGMVITLQSNQNIYFSAAVAHRAPSRSDFRDADPGQEVLPERLIDYELGYRLKNSNFNLEANAYLMDYKDQLVMTGKINNVGEAIRTNVASSYRAGVELQAGIRFTDYFEWNANATVSQNKIRNFISYTDDWYTWPVQHVDTLGTVDISFSPALMAGSNISIYPVPSLKVSLLTRYVGRQYIDNTQTLSRSLDPYLVNDLLINYSWRPQWSKQVDLLLSLNNLFSEAYSSNAWVYTYYAGGDKPEEMNGYYPQALFNFMAGISIHF